MKSGAYFDGYDFRAIGQIADKVILMAYNYQSSTIPQLVMDSGFTGVSIWRIGIIPEYSDPSTLNVWRNLKNIQ